MLFNEKYPKAAVGKIIEYDGDFLLLAKDENPCWHCGLPTKFIEVSFEARLCSEECNNAKWQEYAEACRKGPEDD